MTATEKTDTSLGLQKLPAERNLSLPSVGTFSPNFSFLSGLSSNRRPSAFTNVHDSRNVSNTASPVDIPARNLVNSFSDAIPMMPSLPPSLFADFPDLPIPPGLVGLFQRRKRKENRPRRQRTTFSSEQTLKLELEYHRTEYITRPRRFELAEVLNLSETQIKIWFQNRRAKDKRIEKAQVDQQIRIMGIGSTSPQYPMTSRYSAFCGACYYKPPAVIGPATTLSRPFL